MPYVWSKQEESNQCLELWPYSSLPNRGFAIFILITFLMLNFPTIYASGYEILLGDIYLFIHYPLCSVVCIKKKL
jgi:hypothetical protein